MQWNVMDELEVIADSFLEEHKKYTYSVELVQAFIESICNADSSKRKSIYRKFAKFEFLKRPKYFLKSSITTYILDVGIYDLQTF